MRLTPDQFLELFEKARKNVERVRGDGVFLGLQLIRDITGTDQVIQEAGHDEIFSLSIEEMCKHEIPEGALERLASWGWIPGKDVGLKHFV